MRWEIMGQFLESKSMGARLRYRDHKMVSFCIQTIIVSWRWIMIWHISPVIRWIEQERDGRCHQCHNPNIPRNWLSCLVISSPTSRNAKSIQILCILFKTPMVYKMTHPHPWFDELLDAPIEFSRYKLLKSAYAHRHVRLIISDTEMEILAGKWALKKLSRWWSVVHGAKRGVIPGPGKRNGEGSAPSGRGAGIWNLVHSNFWNIG
jgi:hypothetical protein